MAIEEKKGSSGLSPVRAKEPDQTPPRENTAAWVEKYVTWASEVLEAHAIKKSAE